MRLTSKQLDRMMIFHNNEVSPRIRKNTLKGKEWDKYFEFTLIGSDIWKLMEWGKINRIQAREYLDKEIGSKYHVK